MKRIHIASILLSLILAASVAIASPALADWGRGGGHMGSGPHHRGMMGGYGDEDTGCPGYGYGRGSRGGEPGYGQGRGYGAPSEEQVQKMDEQREAFRKEVQPLQRKLYEKEMALRSELAKEKLDKSAALKLQKEISDLESQFDQKRLEHRMKMQEIDPDRGMGRGPGSGPRSGSGPCWE